MSRFTLAPDEVHVWVAPLEGNADRLAHHLDTLSGEERDRAARFLHAPSREQFISTRGTLRSLLGGYLNQPASRVRFVNGPQGKPGLPGNELHFNVSHTRGMALFAFTRKGPVGVDVEQSRPMPTYLDMATRFFTPLEAEALGKLPPGISEEAFFRVWTRKEAFLKAVGLGLSGGLERFEVAVPPDDPPRILHIDGDQRAGARWSLTCLPLPRQFCGAVAIEGHDHRLSVRQVGQ